MLRGDNLPKGKWENQVTKEKMARLRIVQISMQAQTCNSIAKEGKEQEDLYYDAWDVDTSSFVLKRDFTSNFFR